MPSYFDYIIHLFFEVDLKNVFQLGNFGNQPKSNMRHKCRKMDPTT